MYFCVYCMYYMDAVYLVSAIMKIIVLFYWIFIPHQGMFFLYIYSAQHHCLSSAFQSRAHGATSTSTHTYSCAQIYTHTRAHTYTHTYIHTHTHLHKRTQTCMHDAYNIQMLSCNIVAVMLFEVVHPLIDDCKKFLQIKLKYA